MKAKDQIEKFDLKRPIRLFFSSSYAYQNQCLHNGIVKASSDGTNMIGSSQDFNLNSLFDTLSSLVNFLGATDKEHSNYTDNSHPNVSLSLVKITGRTKLSEGISETRENKNIAASKDWKNMRAPAKKKFPMLQKFKPSQLGSIRAMKNTTKDSIKNSTCRY